MTIYIKRRFLRDNKKAVELIKEVEEWAEAKVILSELQKGDPHSYYYFRCNPFPHVRKSPKTS